MSLFLRGLKRIEPLALRLWRWFIKVVFHIIKHPIKSVIWFVKVYLLLMALALLITFSLGSQASELNCEGGETPLISHGGCGITAPDVSCKILSMNGTNFGGAVVYTGNSIEGYTQKVSSYNISESPPLGCHDSPTRVEINTHTASFSCSEASYGQTSFTKPYQYTRSITHQYWVVSPCRPVTQHQTATRDRVMTYTLEWSDETECPDSHPIGPISIDDGQTVGNFCYRVPEPAPCDCSALNGESSYTYQSLLAKKGTYSNANMPQCLETGDSTDPDSPSCLCQIIATKWFSQTATINGVEYDRWQPLPTAEQNGQSGIFTGQSCAGEEETPPNEKENCVVMKNGQKYCLADKSEKCVVINGVQQCQSGCGTINGEFVCVESDEDNPDDPLEDPDDNITDPDKPLNDMTKDDFKEINRGIESRLDIIAQLMQRNTDKIGAGTSAVTSKIDGTNKLLGDIKGTLEGIADELSGDGEGDGAGGVEYSTDILEEFVNPNDWEQKNFQTVATAFKERMQQAPVINAVQQFFEVSFSGSCPTWSTSVGMPFGGQFDINIDQLCGDAMTSIWPAIRAIIILIFSFLAFRVAFTNG